MTQEIVICIHKRCRMGILLDKHDLKNKKSCERLGFEFAKLCKKHEVTNI